MHTFFPKSQPAKSSFHSAPPRSPVAENDSGLISELTYSENHPGMTQMLLLPLLQQLSKQSRWQLWLTPQRRLSRNWLRHSGLPLHKMIQTSHSGSVRTVEAMIKALQTGNYSVVLGWVDEEISADDRAKLIAAANSGRALGLIMKPERRNLQQSGPLSGLKIHSSLYH